MTQIDFPAKLRFLFEPARYKVAHGGRGGAKSWGFARALLLMGYKKPLRAICVREYQNSIQESVHYLLKDQIDALGLSDFYQVLESEIRGANGTMFVFAGVKNNPSKIKSAEGFDVCWVEEAEKVSEESWRVLIPTFRREGSEIWVSFNPHLQTDATYQRFVVNPPPGAVVVEINWRDNPWFPEVLEKERQHLEKTDPELYLHVWEGHCLPVGNNQLIGMEEAYRATKRVYRSEEYDFAPKIIGVDVARYGGDRSVVFPRQGLVAFRPKVFTSIDNMSLAGVVAQSYDKWNADAIMIDAGRGEGVIDRLLQMGYSPIPVNFGGNPLNRKYANKRSEILDLAAQWIKERGAIPDMADLITDLSAPTYEYSNNDGKFEVESSKKMKARGCKSIDLFAGLAITFAFPVTPKPKFPFSTRSNPRGEYDPIARADELMQRNNNRNDYNPFERG